MLPLNAIAPGKVEVCGVVSFNRQPKKAAGQYMLMIFILDDTIENGLLVLYFSKLENMPNVENGDIVYVEGLYQIFRGQKQIKAQEIKMHPNFQSSDVILRPLIELSNRLYGTYNVEKLQKSLSTFTELYSIEYYDIIVQIKSKDIMTRSRCVIIVADYTTNDSMAVYESAFDSMRYSIMNVVCWDEMIVEIEKLKCGDVVLIENLKTKLDNDGVLEGALRAPRSKISLLNRDSEKFSSFLKRKVAWYGSSITYTKITELSKLKDIKRTGYYKVNVNLINFYPKLLLSSIYIYCYNCLAWNNLDVSNNCQNCEHTDNGFKYSYQFKLVVEEDNLQYFLELSYEHASLFFGHVPRPERNRNSPNPILLLNDFKEIKKNLHLGIFFEETDNVFKITDTVCIFSQ
eukprot:NODE_469_length_7049_cov_0.468489.p1 type:complete len:402 gc:universal NODE_469_length_7049_cov_0.468489:1708-503(-)